jgi:hypothetical protein
MLEFGETPNPLSREPDGLDDAALMAEIFGEKPASGDSKNQRSSYGNESTGDPELDAYLANDSDDDEDSGGMENIDDLDDLY